MRISLSKEEIENWIAENKTMTELASIHGFTKSAMCQYAKKMGICLKIGRPIGIPMSEEQKENLSQRFSGIMNPFYGKKHSKSTRKEMSENHADFSGDKNPYRNALKLDSSKRDEASERMKNWWKDLTPEERKTNKTKRSKSQANSSHQFPMPNSISGHYNSLKGDRIFYRSSWELAFIKELDKNQLVKNFKLEPFTVKYFDIDGVVRYTRIDFLIYFINNKIAMVEIKPKGLINENGNLEKIKGQLKYCIKNKWEYAVVSQINDLDIIIKALYNRTAKSYAK